MASYPLCVGTPVIGQISETFVCKHANEILKGRTAMMASFALPTESSFWSPVGPTLIMDSDVRWARGAAKLFRRLVSQKGAEKRLIDFLKSHGVEALMVEYLDSFTTFLEPVKAAGIRWYSFGHGYDISERLSHPYWSRQYAVHKQADGIFVRADLIRRRLIEFGLPSERIHVVYGGVEVPILLPERITSDHVTLLAVGRMVPKKAPLLLIKSVEMAMNRVPNLQLHFIGNGPLFESAQEYVRKMNLESRIVLHGAQKPPFVMGMMTKTDIFVQHSIIDPVSGDEEGLPTAILEAMAHKVPVVSTLHAGIPEAVDEGESGYLVAEGDIEAMASRIVDLALDRDKRLAFGEFGYKKAKAVFTWETERQRILDLTGLADA